VPNPLAFDAPVRGSLSEYCHDVWCGKNDLAARRRTLFEDTFIRFDRIHERDGHDGVVRVNA